MSDGVRLRPARPGDVEDVLEVAEAAYRGEGGWTTEAHLVRGARTDADEVLGMIADEAVTLLVAEDTEAAGRVVACCYTRRESAVPGRPSRAELGLFAVHPSAQSRGLGSSLLEAQAELLAAAGVEVLRIRVLQGRPELHAWYERHGFVRTGRTLPFPADPSALTVEGLGMDEMERPLPRA